MLKFKQFYLYIGIIICLFVSGIIYYDYVEEEKYSSKMKIGVTYMTMNNTFYQAINNEIQKVVNEHNDLLLTRDPALDQEKQVEQIYDLVEEGIDVLIINPVNSSYVSSALKDAKEKGIKIIVVDAPINNQNIADCTIVSNNYDAGVQCAKNMMATLSHANIVLLEHNSVLSAVDRINGFKDTIKGNNNYHIISETDCLGQTEIALPKMREIIKKHKNFQVVMALNDPSALGALAALEEANMKNILVYGVDGAPDMKKLMNASSEVQATASQSPTKMGKEVADIIYKMKNNEKYESEIIIPITMITKDNINDYTLSGWQ